MLPAMVHVRAALFGWRVLCLVRVWQKEAQWALFMLDQMVISAVSGKPLAKALHMVKILHMYPKWVLLA
jgi:hypothetical protein